MRRRLRQAWGWRGLVALAVAVCALRVAVWAADGPLTPLMNLKGRTDANGYLMTNGGAKTGSDGPLTPLANLRGRTDANGYLRVVVSGVLAAIDTITFSGGSVLVGTSSNIIEQRNGTTAQTACWYNTYTSATDYERACAAWSGNVFTLGTQIGSGGGTDRVMRVGGTTSQLQLSGGGAIRWLIDAGGLTANTDNAIDLGATGSGRPRNLFLAAPSVTSGADATVVSSGAVRDLTYKATVTGATCVNANGFIKAGLTADCTILTLPAKTKILDIYADVTAGFTCSATCSGTKTIGAGISAGGVEILAAAFNVATTGQAGDADAELGSALTRAAAIQGGYLPSWSSTTPVIVRFTSGTGNWGDGAATFVNAGSVTFYVTTRAMQ